MRYAVRVWLPWFDAPDDVAAFEFVTADLRSRGLANQLFELHCDESADGFPDLRLVRPSKS